MGIFLTTTKNAGTGNVIPLADANYFINGYGKTNGDLIQLQGQKQTAQITSINYLTNIITVDKNLTLTSGLGVSLTYSGSASDIGAYECNVTTVADEKINAKPNHQHLTKPFNESDSIDFTNINKPAGVHLSFHLYNIPGKEEAAFNNISSDNFPLLNKRLIEV